MREFIKGITVSIITILTFSCSGFRLEQIDIVEIINKCQEQETETHVLLTDYSFYHAYNTSLGFRHRINRVKAQQLIDISKPQNQGGSGNIGDPTKKECNCRYSVSCGASNICLDNDNQRLCEKIVGCGLIGNSTCTGICDNDLF